MEGEDDMLVRGQLTEDHMSNADSYTPEEYDKYIGAEVLLPVGSEMLKGVDWLSDRYRT